MKKQLLTFIALICMVQALGFAQTDPGPETTPAVDGTSLVTDNPGDTNTGSSETPANTATTPAATPGPGTTPDPAASSGTTEKDPGLWETDHYSVRSDSGLEDAKALAVKLEAWMGIFNEYFRFDASAMERKLKVRIYGNKADFDRYLQRLINQTRSEYVYLHYHNSARSELVGFKDESAATREESIIHQAFVQYLRAFIPNPPLWLREGFAVYFENIAWDPKTQTASFQPNLAWLETSKDILYGTKISQYLDLETLLAMGSEEARTRIADFYPQAWAMVHYLASSDNKDHNRILWDSIRLIASEATLDQNVAKVKEAFAWENPAALKDSVVAFYKSTKTFRELVMDGVDAYAAGSLDKAREDFTKALTLRTDNHIPYYYLGLIDYDKSQFGTAREMYLKALESGADQALTKYALGVNAFADNRYEEATTYLKDAQTLNPAYGDKVKELLERMEV